MRELDKVDAGFVAGAPVAGSQRQRIPSSAAALFRCLEDAGAWPVWLEAIDEVTWTSNLGPGATRTIRQRNLITEERFFEWVPGEVMGFRFDRSQLPLFRAFAERYEIQPISADECELAWSYGFAARGPFKVAQPLIAAFFERIASNAIVQLAEYMAVHGAEYA